MDPWIQLPIYTQVYQLISNGLVAEFAAENQRLLKDNMRLESELVAWKTKCRKLEAKVGDSSWTSFLEMR